MLIIQGNEIAGLISPITQEELALQPMQDGHGVNWYVLDNEVITHHISGYNLRRRTQAEMDALRDPPLLPAIYVRCVMSKQFVCADADSLPFVASIRVGAEPEAPLVPISAAWPILFRQKDGLSMDNIMLSFVDGECAAAYVYKAGLPLGEWYIDEKDFDTVDLGGVSYAVKLAEPVRFTVYRVL